LPTVFRWCGLAAAAGSVALPLVGAGACAAAVAIQHNPHAVKQSVVLIEFMSGLLRAARDDAVPSQKVSIGAGIGYPSMSCAGVVGLLQDVPVDAFA